MRNIDVSSRDGLSEAEIRPVIEGVTPTPQLLDRLAGTLGLHVQDLIVLAGLPVPEELSPLDPAAASSTTSIAFAAVTLPRERTRELIQLVQALPQEERRKSVPQPKQYSPGPGTLLLGLLDNRNLARYHTAKATYLGSRGTIYLSEATVHQALVRNKQLTTEMFTGLANVIGIPPGELAVLTGFDMEPSPSLSQAVPAIVAELIWLLRRLSSEQARHVWSVARSMLQEES